MTWQTIGGRDLTQDQNDDLRKRIVEHCAMMAKHDRAYAVFAWKQYCEALPWLELDQVKKVQTNE